MKRLLLIFLLTMLPLQMSWAALTGYCQHEEGRAAQHLGHHEHKHHAAGDSKQSDNKKSKSNLGVNDADCGYCHLSCANLVSTQQPEIIFPPNSIPVEFLLYSYRSHIADGLSRPDWQLAI